MRTHRTHSGYASPQDAEAAFYKAFNDADPEAMMSVWATDNDIECIHPLGRRLRGVKAVSQSWRKLLARKKRMQFRLSQTSHIRDERLAVHIMYENISMSGKVQPPVIATNIYRFNGSGWQMILHHASLVTDMKASRQHESGNPETPLIH